MHQLIVKWAEQLAAILGRPAEAIREKGLSGYDFPSDHDLRITLMDGSFMQFKFAIHVLDAENQMLAVFTEYCGYHEFYAHDAVVTRVVYDVLYNGQDGL